MDLQLDNHEKPKLMYYYELNGKTIRIKSLDELLNFNEQDAIAENRGSYINNPFFDTHSANEEEMEEDILNIELPTLDSIEELELDEDITD